jgi:DNA-directed RNA polymerase subunit RPC12/RpoP
MALKSLSEHNQNRLVGHQAADDLMEPHPNGIACPKCSQEMWDSSPGLVLYSIPPRKDVHCPACGHRSTALQ